jgi:hypothetical protein
VHLVVDKHNTKIAVSDLEKLEQLLDQTPAHRDTVISKRQAIGRLAPKLHAMRGKGYSWNAVAQWLSEHGLSVSTGVLNGYLRDTVPTHATASVRLPKAGRKFRPTPAAPVVMSAPAPVQAASAPVPAQREVNPSKPAAKEPIALKREQGARRSEFPVRPDSDEI